VQSYPKWGVACQIEPKGLPPCLQRPLRNPAAARDLQDINYKRDGIAVPQSAAEATGDCLDDIGP